MNINYQTTYVFLDRGSEDVALLNDIRRIVTDLKLRSIRDYIKRYPKLHELQNGLEGQMHSDDGEK